jgi:hypothetical protein
MKSLTYYHSLNSEDLTDIQQENLTTAQKSIYKYCLHEQRYQQNLKQYKKNIENLEKGECIFVIDFKENVKLGGSSREVQQQFYTNHPVSVFCITAIYKEYDMNQKPKIIREYHNYVSNVLNHDTQYVRECILELLSTSKFFCNFHTLYFWMDGGPHHFRTHEMTYTLVSLSNLEYTVHWNYFVEYHGKNVCDSHFAILSKYLSAYERQSEVPLTSLNDLVSMFETAIERNNYERIHIFDLEPQIVTFTHYERLVQPSHKKQVKIPHFKQNFHFYIINGSDYLFYKKTITAPWIQLQYEVTEKLVTQELRHSY